MCVVLRAEGNRWLPLVHSGNNTTLQQLPSLSPAYHLEGLVRESGGFSRFLLNNASYSLKAFSSAAEKASLMPNHGEQASTDTGSQFNLQRESSIRILVEKSALFLKILSPNQDFLVEDSQKLSSCLISQAPTNSNLHKPPALDGSHDLVRGLAKEKRKEKRRGERGKGSGNKIEQLSRK